MSQQIAPANLPPSIARAGAALRAQLQAQGLPVPGMPNGVTGVPDMPITPYVQPVQQPVMQQQPVQQQVPAYVQQQPHPQQQFQQQPIQQPIQQQFTPGVPNQPGQPQPPVQQQQVQQVQQPQQYQPAPVYVDPNRPFDAPGAAPAAPAMSPEMNTLIAQNRELMKMLADRLPGNQSDNSIKLNVRDIPVDPKALETYKGADPYIRKVAMDMVAEAAAPLVAEVNRLRTVTEQQAAQLGQRVDSVGATGFQAAMAAAVPDLSVLSADPRFQAFLNEPVPNAPHTTVRSLMSAAFNSHNVGTIKANVDLFKARYGMAPGQPQQQQIQPQVQQLMQPTPAMGGQTPPTQQQQQQGPVLTKSMRDADFAAYRGGRLTHEDWTMRQNAYDRAAVSGTFDYTK